MNILFHLIRGTLSRFRSIVFAARKKQKKSIRKDECAILLSLLLFLLVNPEKTSQGGKIYAVGTHSISSRDEDLLNIYNPTQFA